MPGLRFLRRGRRLCRPANRISETRKPAAKSVVPQGGQRRPPLQTFGHFREVRRGHQRIRRKFSKNRSYLQGRCGHRPLRKTAAFYVHLPLIKPRVGILLPARAFLSFCAEEEDGDHAGAGMRADDGADVVDNDILDRRALADVVGDEFRVVVAVAVADEHRLRRKVG